MESVQIDQTTKWYAVYTRPRFEKQVCQRLLEQGIEAYLPLIKTMRQQMPAGAYNEVDLAIPVPPVEQLAIAHHRGVGQVGTHCRFSEPAP